MVALSAHRNTLKGGWNHVKRVKDAHPHRVTIVKTRAHIRHLRDIKAQTGVSPWARTDCVCWRGDQRKTDGDYRTTIAFKTAAELEQFMKEWHLDHVDQVGGIDLTQELSS